jgi:hypothetical protein
MLSKQKPTQSSKDSKIFSRFKKPNNIETAENELNLLTNSSNPFTLSR